MIRRAPIRIRLTIAFAAAMSALLVVGGLLTYLAVRSELDEAINASLAARAEALRALATDRRPTLPEVTLDPEEGFAQILSADGELLAAAGGPPAPALGSERLGQARREPIFFEADLTGVEGTARVLARPADAAAGGRVVVVGESLEDRDETLAGLLGTLAIGGPVGIAAASLVGYLLAAAGLRPVEAMRRRAESVSLQQPEALPLPSAEDEVRRLGVTLNEMLDRLRRSFRRERQFVADASHELRTPVAVLKAEIEAAIRTDGLSPEAEESLAAALEECDNLAQLAEDLLLIARSGEAAVPLDRHDVDARELLARVRERFGYRAERNRRALTVEAGEGLLLDVDRHRVAQAVGNLVDNALRHGAGHIAIGAREAGAAAELYVRDQGPGFPAELAGREFERFSRGDAARTRGGAGLGLAIVEAIAAAHGGEAEVSQRAPTEVRFRVPRARSGAPATE